MTVMIQKMFLKLKSEYVLKNHAMTCGIENNIYILGKF